MANCVRREVDAGADLAQRRGLLIDRHLEALRDQRIGGEQAADAAADNRDVRFGVWHYRFIPAIVLNLSTSFRGGAKRRARNPEVTSSAWLWISDRRCA